MEERMLDDEAGRKIKLKKVKDGVDVVEDDGADAELEIEDGLVEERTELLFDLPELESDEEDADQMTPEAFAELQRKHDEEARVNRHIGNLLLEEGERYLEGGKYAEAEGKFQAATVHLGRDFAAYFGLLRALTADFTEVREIARCRQVYDTMISVSTKADRDMAREKFGGRIGETLAALEAEQSELASAVAAKRQERASAFRENFRAKRNRAVVSAVITAVLLIAVVCLVPYIYTVRGSAFLIATIAVGCLAAVSAVVFLFLLRSAIYAGRLVFINQKNRSTADGRRLDYVQEAIDFWRGLYL